MRALDRFAIRHPVAALAIGLAVVAALAPGIGRLRLRTDGQALVPEDAPAVRVDRAVRERFSVRDPVVVTVVPRDPRGIFNPGTPALLVRLTRALAALPEVGPERVRSLATERSDRFRPGTLERAGLLDPLPGTPAELARLRDDLEALAIHRGVLVSTDGRAAAILVDTPPAADRAALARAIAAAAAGADTAGHRVSVIGAPVAEALLGDHILADLGVGAGAAPAPEPGSGAWAALRRAAARVGLLPLSIAVMALVFLAWFRSGAAALLPLGEAGACLAAVFGLMGWTGVPVYLTLAVLPVILVSMGLADELHVFASYARRRAARPGAPVREAVAEALDETRVPVIATSLTTAAGFLSFAASPLPPVRAFGVFTAVGIVFCMLWTLAVIPALLVLLAPRGFPRAAGGAAPRWVDAAMAASRRPALAVAAVVLLGLAAVDGIRRLEVQDSWISGFARDSEFARATRDFDRRFHGTHRLLLALDAGRLEARLAISEADLGLDTLLLPAGSGLDPAALPGCSLRVSRRDLAGPGEPYRPATWTSLVRAAVPRGERIAVVAPPDHGSARFLMSPLPGESLEVRLASHRLAMPEVLERIAELEDFLRSRERWAVGGALGPPDLVATAEYAAGGREPGTRRVPRDPERVLWLWAALEGFEGERLRAVVDSTLSRGLVTVFLKHANFADTARLLAALRDYERDRLRPAGIRLEVAGDVAVSQVLVGAIVDSQVRSIVLSLAGIVLVTALLLRSVGLGLLCALPAGLAVAATFAVLGWTGTPLGVATSMFAAMVLGVGVDFAIHLVERARAAAARGAGREEAVREALTATGPPILANAAAVTLGFGLLVLSRVPANARLGAIVVVSLAACVAATLLLVPALLRLGRGSATSR